MEVVGREAELAAVRALVESGRALVLTGEPGIGKTSLWRAGIDAAREHGLRVLVAQPASGEVRLSFAALGDLLDGQSLAGVPGPQRHALEVALLTAEPEGGPPEPRAIAAGLLSALRALAPLLVAIDDVQWLDAPSADALAFAARRLSGWPVRFLLARRHATALERALAPARLALGPLGLDSTRRLLAERLGLALPRRLMRTVFDTSGGNPLFALELGRALANRAPPEVGEELALPDALEDLVGARVEAMPPAVRGLLLALALGGDVRESELPDAALRAGAVVLDGERVRLAHPLLGAVARSHATPAERRALHLQLVQTSTDQTQQARHLALAARRPDAELAATLAAASEHARRRGAAYDAAELARHAFRLTPPDCRERPERLLALCEQLVVLGEVRRAARLLTPQLEFLPSGAARVRAQVLLADVAPRFADSERHLDAALNECVGEPQLRARVLAQKATHAAVGRVERIREAEGWAAEALSAAGDAAGAALQSLAWARSLRGGTLHDLTALGGTPVDLSLERVVAVRHVWRGELAPARGLLDRLLALADARGEEWAYAVLRMHRCELELRAGAWDAAERLLDEWREDSAGEMFVSAAAERCRALLAAGRGDAEAAARWASEAIAGADAAGAGWDRLEGLRARGVAQLLEHQPEQAAESLRAVWEHTQREGIADPGAFPVAPDLVEALSEAGDEDAAREVGERLRELSDQQDHPWGRAGTQRCRAVLGLPADAQPAERLGLRFDSARTRLALGRAHRRSRRWGAARSALEQAVKEFDTLGSPGWAEQARAELARVGARRRLPSGQLSDAERRVAELAAAGRANKEIAQALFISVHTVETHLTRTYAKLGVRSRTQLGARLRG